MLYHMSRRQLAKVDVSQLKSSRQALKVSDLLPTCDVPAQALRQFFNLFDVVFEAYKLHKAGS